MNRPRLICGLRIAWTAMFGILGLLLAVLWVRSYWWRDEFGVLFSGDRRLALLQSHPGRLGASLDMSDESEPYPLDYYGRMFNTNRAAKYEFEFSLLFGRLTASNSAVFSEIEVPYWLLIALAISIGACAHIRSTYSLRTLLIATTLIAVVLGVIVWSSS